MVVHDGLTLFTIDLMTDQEFNKQSLAIIHYAFHIRAEAIAFIPLLNFNIMYSYQTGGKSTGIGLRQHYTTSFLKDFFGEQVERRFVSTFAFVSVGMGEMMLTDLSGILGIEGCIAMGAVAAALHTFGNIIDVDEGTAFIQRKSQECAHS